eukprot:SAG11_NODE_13425_length_655_cov_2.120504_2_plen_63_part_00
MAGSVDGDDAPRTFCPDLVPLVPSYSHTVSTNIVVALPPYLLAHHYMFTFPYHVISPCMIMG